MLPTQHTVDFVWALQNMSHFQEVGSYEAKGWCASIEQRAWHVVQACSAMLALPCSPSLLSDCTVKEAIVMHLNHATCFHFTSPNSHKCQYFQRWSAMLITL